MRLKRLVVSNFRGISHLELVFPERSRTTVLVGINGVGKSTLLDAIVLSMLHAPTSPKERQGLNLHPEDIQVGQSNIRVEAFVELELVNGGTVADDWEVEAYIPDPHGFVHDKLSRQQRGTTETVRPFVILYYSVDRMVRTEPSTESQEHPPAGELGIHVKSADYMSFFAWFEDREDLENEKIRENRSYSDPEMDAVRSAIELLLPGFRDLRVRRTRSGEYNRNSRIVVKKNDQEFELGQLSHGERGLLAMTGDIARRLALCSSANDDPRMRPGVILIDEIDLHLHPQWQRDVIPRLERTFPNLQFIVTTHSPQIISQLHPDSVRILEDFAIVPVTPHTYGRDTNAILSDIMGVEERPGFARAWLRSIAELMDEELWDKARVALDLLATSLGSHDAEVVRLRTMIDILAPDHEARV